MNENENKNLARWIEGVDQKLDNHMHEILPKLASVENDVKWLKGFFWKVSTPIFSAIGVGIIYLIYLVQ